MNKVSNYLYRISSCRIALVGIAAFLVFMALVLPAQAEKAATYAADVGSPDQTFFYTTDDLYTMAEAYGAEGRAAYVQARLTFDVIFPIFYAFFLGTSISWVFNKAFAPKSRWRLLNLFPILGLIFDYLENTGASIVMTRFPVLTPGVADITPYLSIIKWFFVNGSFVVLVFGLIMWAFTRYRSRKQ